MGHKFLVCTMHCGELDFPHHVEALQHQGVEVDHRVFKDMVEVDAHNAVYQAFNEAGPEWIRAKVDADVVLHPGMLEKVASSITGNTWYDPQTHDFFTDKPLHAGVAIYGPDVRFKVQTLTLKCDRDVAKNANQVGGILIGKHAHYADEWTAFHFGFHRGLKSQLPVLDQVRRAHSVHKDSVRFMALRGFEVAQSDLYKDYHLGHAPSPMDHNYGSPVLRELFDRFKDPSVAISPRTWR